MATDKTCTLKETALQLKNGDHFLLITHRNPDGDTVGSAAALCRILRALGKEAFLLKNSGITHRYLSLIEGLTAPCGYNPQNIVHIDVAAPIMLDDDAALYADCADFVIDHHLNNCFTAKVRFVDPTAAATGEIIYRLAVELGVQPDESAACALYTAIATDTGCFRYGNTTSRTHEIAARLMETGIDAAAINRALFETRSKARFELERMIYSRMRFFCGGRGAAMEISLAMRRETGAGEEDIEDIASLPRQIEGVDVGITLKEQEDGAYKVSVRTTPAVNAAVLCAQFGGGGHAQAAGCTIAGCADDVMNQLQEKIIQILRTGESK